MVSALVCVLVLAHLSFIVLDSFGVGVRAGLGPFVVVLDGVGVGVGVRAGLGPFIVVLDGVRGLGPFAVVLDVASALVFVLVLARSSLYLMALVLALALVLVLARSLLYSMASALGWVLACSSYPLVLRCWWCWRGRF